MTQPVRSRNPVALTSIKGSGPTELAARKQLGDPLAPIIALGRKQARIGAVIGLLGALALHGAPGSQAFRSFNDLRTFTQDVISIVRHRLGSELEVEAEKPPPPPPPPEPEPPKPEPEPPPVAKAAPPPKAAAEAPPPPPAPAEAGKVLTQDPDPNAPVDLTGEGFVTGTADRYAGGITATRGTSKVAVRDTNATPGGVPGGTGVKLAPPPPAEDRSRPAAPDRNANWRDCPFPPDADIEGINEARVRVSVVVGPDSRPKSVTVLDDPGHGFGRVTRDCVLRKPFIAGLDRSGQPVTQTAVFWIRFTR
ncbi:MAG TPA: energy transducer TonB [Polyangiaceae bacterium]|nr:energy transducer TonB [Polyangiaceae bacterium]